MDGMSPGGGAGSESGIGVGRPPDMINGNIGIAPIAPNETNDSIISDAEMDDLSERARLECEAAKRTLESTKQFMANFDFQQRERNQLPPRIRFFPKDMKGPYCVYIRKFVENASLPEVTLTKRLTRKYKTIKSIKMIVKEKMCVEFKDREEANKLPKDEEFTKDYHVYIQCAGVEIQGVIPFSLAEPLETICKEGSGRLKAQMTEKIEIIDARRLYKVNKEGDKKTAVPINFARVTFSGLVLPDVVEIDKLLLPVRYYTENVLQCKKCLRYNHTERFCYAKQRCDKCGEFHEKDSQCGSSIFKCPNCKGSFPDKNHTCKKKEEIRARQHQNAEQKHYKLYSEIVKQTSVGNNDNGLVTGVESTNIYAALNVEGNDYVDIADTYDCEKNEGAEMRANKLRSGRPKRKSPEHVDEAYWSSLSAGSQSTSTANSSDQQNIPKKKVRAASSQQNKQKQDEHNWIDKGIDKILEWLQSFGLPAAIIEMIRAFVVPMVKDMIEKAISSFMTRIMSGLSGQND